MIGRVMKVFSAEGLRTAGGVWFYFFLRIALQGLQLCHPEVRSLFLSACAQLCMYMFMHL